MLTSEKTQEITSAIIKLQEDVESVLYDKTNPMYKSGYATLGAIISTIKPHLIKNGLAVLQTVTSTNDKIGVTTRILHASGEWFEDTAYLTVEPHKPQTIPQAAGVAITYLRRYEVSAMLNLYSEEDNDGGINDGFEKQPKQVPGRRPYNRKAKNSSREEPDAPDAEETEDERIEALREEFKTSWNKCRALGNTPDELPKLKAGMTESEVLEKLAEVNIILKQSEEE